MAGKKNSNEAVIQQLMKLGPLKAAIVLVVAAIVWLFGGGNLPITQDTHGNVSTNPDIVAGVVVRVVDGDTAVVRVDGQDRRVRMLGVDTPETVHPNKPVQFYGKEASNFTKEALNGRQVWLEYDQNPQDRYNRHLAYVWLKNPGTINEASIREGMFNARLLLGGYGKVMIIKPNKRYEELFKKFQEEAKSARLGVWSQ